MTALKERRSAETKEYLPVSRLVSLSLYLEYNLFSSFVQTIGVIMIFADYCYFHSVVSAVKNAICNSTHRKDNEICSFWLEKREGQKRIQVLVCLLS